MGASGRRLYRDRRQSRKFPPFCHKPLPQRPPELDVTEKNNAAKPTPCPATISTSAKGATLTRDSCGQELPDVEAAREEAIATGRALLGEGRGLYRTIEIVDGAERGHVVDEVNARDILFHTNYSGSIQPTPENSPCR